MTIEPGAFVTRKGGDGTQMLVTSLTGGFSRTLPPPLFANVSYFEDGAMTFASIPTEDLDLQVTDAERAGFSQAHADAESEIRLAEWKLEQDRLEAEEAANQARIAAALEVQA